MSIHPAAVVDSRAEIHPDVEIGPFAVIDGPVKIDEGSKISSHVMISGHTVIGKNNIIDSFASIGSPPQDIGYKGEDTRVVIGDNNHIREYVSIHRGTVTGHGETVVGNDCMVMAYCHIAHDCVVGDNVIMANLATLSGHVEIGDYVNLGGMVAIHQFCRIGKHSYIGGMSGITRDVSPFVILSGTRNQMRISGLNKIGLRRRGFSREVISNLEQAYKIIFRSRDMLVQESLAKVMAEVPGCQEVVELVEFFQGSKRGVVTRTDDDTLK